MSRTMRGAGGRLVFASLGISMRRTD